ncbi:lipoprotein [Spiroplasma tabanidicola]|uniref:Lipoprotein n=1 Tax=Spiroplasma tabanidicola TaxID=324079 RepID=A0A6I6CBY4_9MOLU|nr:lipoprotein [Spiroplasma tabanidicola]QGS51444.1 hypothetical protein STABA_v1c00770 [Spiroplasma tabanidicola]
MKKLLSLLGAMGMVATSSSVAVACGNDDTKKDSDSGNETSEPELSLDELVAKHKEMLDKYVPLEKIVVDGEPTFEQRVECNKMWIYLSESAYKICKIDASKLPENQTIIPLNSKEEFLKSLKDAVKDLKEESPEVYEQLKNDFDKMIEKYSK